MILEIHQLVNRLDKLVQLDFERLDGGSEEQYILVMDAIRSLPMWRDYRRGKYQLPANTKCISATPFAFECLFELRGDQTQPVPLVESVTLDLIHSGTIFLHRTLPGLRACSDTLTSLKLLIRPRIVLQSPLRFATALQNLMMIIQPTLAPEEKRLLPNLQSLSIIVAGAHYNKVQTINCLGCCAQ